VGAGLSPTARTKKLLEAEGFAVEVVERWIPGANIRRDLWGFLDVLAIRDQETVGVQVTTSDHLANRRRKILASPLLQRVLGAGWRIEIHGWRKVKGRWAARREMIDCTGTKSESAETVDDSDSPAALSNS
jgi:hypothetical protein